MANLIIVGVIVACIGALVYALRNQIAAEKEMATSRETQKVALDKVEVLENAALEDEYAIREHESQEIKNARDKEPTYTRSTIGFYPDRLSPKDPDDLN